MLNTDTAESKFGLYDKIPHTYNPEHHERTKHMCHFYVRELVEAGELVVPFVCTADNVAYFFTKPLPPRAFIPMRNIIMNSHV